MRKKFFKTLSALAIAAVLALNVTVVLDDNAVSYLRFDTIGQIFADGTSGSGSGSGSGCQPTCSPGEECVNGTCVELEKSKRQACVIRNWIGVKKCDGHETSCPADPAGINNCSAKECACD